MAAVSAGVGGTTAVALLALVDAAARAVVAVALVLVVPVVGSFVVVVVVGTVAVVVVAVGVDVDVDVDVVVSLVLLVVVAAVVEVVVAAVVVGVGSARVLVLGAAVVADAAVSADEAVAGGAVVVASGRGVANRPASMLSHHELSAIRSPTAGSAVSLPPAAGACDGSSELLPLTADAASLSPLALAAVAVPRPSPASTVVALGLGPSRPAGSPVAEAPPSSSSPRRGHICRFGEKRGRIHHIGRQRDAVVAWIQGVVAHRGRRRQVRRRGRGDHRGGNQEPSNRHSVGHLYVLYLFVRRGQFELDERARELNVARRVWRRNRLLFLPLHCIFSSCVFVCVFFRNNIIFLRERLSFFLNVLCLWRKQGNSNRNIEFGARSRTAEGKENNRRERCQLKTRTGPQIEK